MPDLGIVVIARNEGERLRRSLKSVHASSARIAYVDSGSTDGSQEFARSLPGVQVIDLDTSVPFTAARARNVGWRHLVAQHPELALVQFVDGDCEIREGWIAAATQRMHQRPELAVVFGRQRELYPDASIFNRFIDIEWNVPVGDVEASAGTAMMRVGALQEAQGFNDSLIAGEEPDLCLRMRQQGWKVERLDQEMSLHDADMHSVRQWWQRMVRGGFAYAEGAMLHGRTAERHWVRNTLRAIAYGAVLPAFAAVTWRRSRGASGLMLLAAYAYRGSAAYRMARSRDAIPQHAVAYGAATVASALPELQGILRYARTRLAGRAASLIEYK